MKTMLCLLSFSALVVACTPKDTTAPPSPHLDPIASPTSATSVTLTGTAEYAATVKVNGGAREVTAQADPVSGRFQLPVPLNPLASNALSVTAVDASGNISAPIEVTVVQQSAQPETTLASITVNGVPCDPAAGTPPGCTVHDSDTVTLTVSAKDDQPLSQLSYSVYFPSSGSVKSETILVPANTFDASSTFSFHVNSNAVETVDLVASARDTQGRENVSAPVPLNVTFGAFGIGGRTLGPVFSGSALDRPSDIAFDSAGDLFILSNGSAQVLEIPTGASAPVAVASLSDQQFIATAVDAVTGVEQLYISRPSDGRLWQMKLDGTSLTAFADPGSAARGLDMLGATQARGWVDVAAVAAGDTLTLAQGGVQEVYEFENTAGACSGSHVCVVFAPGASGTTIASALASAIGGNSTLVDGGTNGSKTLVRAKIAGETGNGISLAATGSMVVSGSNLAEGHFREPYLATDGDNLVRRYQLDAGPYAAGSDHGAFPFQNGDRLWSVAIRDDDSANSTDLSNLLLYGVDDVGNGFRSVRAQRARRTATGTTVSTVFTVTDAAYAGQGTVAFDTLWDIALSPSGCLLVTDRAARRVYSIDVRNSADTNPSTSVVADGFVEPEGLTFDGSGKLLIADRGANTIYRLAPKVAAPTATDPCF